MKICRRLSGFARVGGGGCLPRSGYDPAMRTAAEVFDQQFPEMRWRCLSLAADLDRLTRAGGSLNDPRLRQFRAAVQLLLDDAPDKAAAVQMAFSDTTPPPERNPR